MRKEIDRRDQLHKIPRTHARPQSPEKILLLSWQGQVVEEVHVEGVTSLSEFRLKMVCAVEVSLDLEVRPLVQHVLPSAQQIPSRQLRGAVSGNLGGRRIQGVRGRLASPPHGRCHLEA